MSTFQSAILVHSITPIDCSKMLRKYTIKNIERSVVMFFCVIA